MYGSISLFIPSTQPTSAAPSAEQSSAPHSFHTVLDCPLACCSSTTTPSAGIMHCAGQTLVALCIVLLTLLLHSTAAQTSNLTAISLTGSIDRYSQLAIHDIVLAYRLQQPNVTIVQVGGLAGPSTLAQIAAGTVDFATIPVSLTPAQVAAQPTINMYPILATGIVPIYRLDALTSLGVTLVLSRAALAAIYEGQLSWWNDARIKATNPSINLPAQRITVVYHNELLSMNNVFTTALAKFDTNFTQYCSVGAWPSWPSYNSSKPVTGNNAVAAAVTAQDGSIGYAVLALALQLNNHIAALVNKAGQTVTASSQSVTYAAVELGTQTVSRTTLVMDLTDGTGSGVWPICALSYFLVDTVNTLATCRARAALVDFWLWYYQSSVVSGLLSNRHYARVPDVVMTSLNIIENVETQIMCRGNSAYTAVAVTTRIMSVPSSVSFIAGLLTPLFTSMDSKATWSANTVTDQLAFNQLVNGEIDIGFYNPLNVDQSLYNEAADSGDYLILPTFIYANTWVYNTQITSTVNIASYTLRLDLGLVTRIFYSCIIVSHTDSTHTALLFGSVVAILPLCLLTTCCARVLLLLCALGSTGMTLLSWQRIRGYTR